MIKLIGIPHFESQGFTCEELPYGMLLVYKPHDGMSGFQAEVYGFHYGGSWKTNDVEGYVKIRVTAYYDGVRRLEFFNKDGKVSTLECSPVPLEHIATAINRIVELEKQYCEDL